MTLRNGCETCVAPKRDSCCRADWDQKLVNAVRQGDAVGNDDAFCARAMLSKERNDNVINVSLHPIIKVARVEMQHGRTQDPPPSQWGLWETVLVLILNDLSADLESLRHRLKQILRRSREKQKARRFRLALD